MSSKSPHIKIINKINAYYQNGIYKPAEDYADEGTRIVRISDYSNDGVKNFDNLKRVNINETEVERYSLMLNDILINRVNSLSHIGKSCIIDKIEDSMVFESNMMRLRIPQTSEISPKYIFIVLNSSRSRDYFRKVAKPAVAQASINQEDIKSLAVFLPSLEQQTSIAELLFTWDQAIEKTERLITAKKKRFSSLGRTLINEQKKNLGAYNMNLGDVCKPVTRKNNIEETNVLTSSAQHGLMSQLDYYSKNVSGNDLSGYYLLKKGEFAYNRSSAKGYPYGAIKRLDYCTQGVFSTLYLCFKISDKEKVYSDFLQHYFETGCMNRSLRGICQAGARSHGLLNVSKGEFFNLKLFLPPFDQQKQIASILNTAHDEIELLKKLAKAYRTQKRGLMQTLLTSKWKIIITE